jgi:phage gpG-like protein
MAALNAKRAVLGKLGMYGNVTSGMAPTLDIHFEPTLLIAAGRVDRMGMDIRSFKEPLTRAVKKIMIPSIRKNFDSGGRPTWDSLTEATLRIRSYYGFDGAQPLVRTGALERGATQFSIWKIDQATAYISDLPERVWYGRIHQAGYQANSMGKRVAKFKGNRSAAFGSLLSEQRRAIQSGTKMKGGGGSEVPARPFFILQPEDEDGISEVFIEWLDERIERAWPSGAGAVT